MSNHFPETPSSFSLSSITYYAAIGGHLTTSPLNGQGGAIVPVSGSPLYFDEEYASSYVFENQLQDPGPNPSLIIQFPTPGETGSFDQDAVESAFTDAITAYCQAISDLGAGTLSQIQETVGTQRIWTWTDSTSTFTLTYSNSLTYPPA
jgi:hypothetical protein